MRVWKEFRKPVLMLFMVFGLLFAHPEIMKADTATVTFGSESYSAESSGEFMVGVYLRGESQVGTYHVEIEYDANRLEYIGGAEEGEDGIIILEGTGTRSQVKYMLSFRCLSGGEAFIRVSDALINMGTTDNAEQFEITELDAAAIIISGEDTVGELPEPEPEPESGFETTLPHMEQLILMNETEYYMLDVTQRMPGGVLWDYEMAVLPFLEQDAAFLTNVQRNVYFAYLFDESEELVCYAYNPHQSMFYPCEEYTAGEQSYICTSPDACANWPAELTLDIVKERNIVFAIDSKGDGAFCHMNEEGNLVEWNPEDAKQSQDEQNHKLVLILVAAVVVILLVLVGAYITTRELQRKKRIREREEKRREKKSQKRGEVKQEQKRHEKNLEQRRHEGKKEQRERGTKQESRFETKTQKHRQKQEMQRRQKREEGEKLEIADLSQVTQHLPVVDVKVVKEAVAEKEALAKKESTAAKKISRNIESSVEIESPVVEEKTERKRKPVISVRDVTMRFKIATSNVSGIKEYIIQLLKRQISYRELLALDHVSFDVYKGEVVGIIGTNGSGKSTLLRIVSGALEPTEGEVIVNRKKLQLLTLGTGFDMELTAKENVYLNGAIIGYTEEFIKEHYDEIVAFAELEGFMEEKVKNFSSGMVSRLGFAIATVGEASEILILDEVLSVGDEFFRKKSLARIKEMIHGGSTVLMVSHGMGTILEHCTKVVWIEKGVLKMVGEPKVVCGAYQKQFEGKE